MTIRCTGNAETSIRDGIFDFMGLFYLFTLPLADNITPFRNHLDPGDGEFSKKKKLIE